MATIGRFDPVPYPNLCPYRSGRCSPCRRVNQRFAEWMCNSFVAQFTPLTTVVVRLVAVSGGTRSLFLCDSYTAVVSNGLTVRGCRVSLTTAALSQFVECRCITLAVNVSEHFPGNRLIPPNISSNVRPLHRLNLSFIKLRLLLGSNLPW